MVRPDKTSSFMSRTEFICNITSFLLVLSIAVSVSAGEPMEAIKQTTDKVLSIVINPALNPPSKTAEKEKFIRQAADERFDWEEMARRSLAAHWAKRTPEDLQPLPGCDPKRPGRHSVRRHLRKFIETPE
jgi:ABC-type transporter MlaC component